MGCKKNLNQYMKFHTPIHLLIKQTWIIWLLFTTAICIMVYVTGVNNTVTYHYQTAALHWLHAEMLYNHRGTGFIYFPQSALVFIPLTYLPRSVAELFWHAASLLTYAYALAKFAFFCDREKAKQIFFIMSLVALPLAFSSARNGQMNIMLAATMLLAMVATGESQWWRASFWLILGLALKPTMIVLLLLTTALYRPLWWRIPLGLLVLIIIPFLTQNFHYVCEQYIQCAQMLKDAAHVGIVTKDWAQLLSMLEGVGLFLPGVVQTGIRILAALATLLLCYRVVKKPFPENPVIYIFTFATCYLMLFNPRTENNDYVILAPAIGYFLSYAMLHTRNYLKAFFLVVVVVGIAGSYSFGHVMTPGHVCWLAPFMTVVFLVMLICRHMKFVVV